MQYEGRGKAAKVDENVAKWTKICRSTVYDSDLSLEMKDKAWMRMRTVSGQQPTVDVVPHRKILFRNFSTN